MQPGQTDAEGEVLHMLPIVTNAATRHMMAVEEWCVGLAKDAWVFNGVDDEDWQLHPPVDSEPWWGVEVVVRDAERRFELRAPQLGAWSKSDAVWEVHAWEVSPNDETGAIDETALPVRHTAVPWWHGDASVVAAAFFSVVAEECACVQYLVRPQFERSSPSRGMRDMVRRWVQFNDGSPCMTAGEATRALAAIMLVEGGMEPSRVREALVPNHNVTEVR